VEGPIAGTPAGSAPYDPAGAGYVEEEYFLSGVAKTYADPSTNAPYKIRMLVYRPTKSTAFNGTALVEWENVTGQVPGGHPMFAWLDRYAIENGYVFVQVAAQATPIPAGIAGHGELGHVAFDPQRYGSLRHPGDAYSHDIYSQAMKSLTERFGANPVGGLNVQRVIAMGNSQSSSLLTSYIEQVQPTVGLADAFLLDAGGGKTFTKPVPVPTIAFISEDGFSATEPTWEINGPLYRLWEVAGASHNDADFGRNLNAVNRPGAKKRSWAKQQKMFDERHYGEEGLTAHATCAAGPGGNEYPRRYAVDAAVRALEVWLQNGTPAPQPPRVTYNSNGNPATDRHGNVVGGLRLPPIDVPVARYFGSECTLFGMTVPFHAVKLSKLYPSHNVYVAKMQRATDASVANRSMVPQDAAELMRLVRKSTIGSAIGG
jgi:hypothetical protein